VGSKKVRLHNTKVPRQVLVSPNGLLTPRTTRRCLPVARRPPLDLTSGADSFAPGSSHTTSPNPKRKRQTPNARTQKEKRQTPNARTQKEKRQTPNARTQKKNAKRQTPEPRKKRTQTPNAKRQTPKPKNKRKPNAKRQNPQTKEKTRDAPSCCGGVHARHGICRDNADTTRVEHCTAGSADVDMHAVRGGTYLCE